MLRATNSGARPLDTDMCAGRATSSGFTLVELMVSMAILSLMVVLLAGMVDHVSSIWTFTRSRVEQFRQAREGFESITRRLSQATLNTYYDYADASGNLRTPDNASTFVPFRYTRVSELRFVSGPNLASLATPSDPNSPAPPRPTHSVFFQAPLGLVGDPSSYGSLENLLNTWGYYLEFNSDAASRPPFVKTPLRYRYRLLELMQPSDALSLYKYTSGNPGLKSSDPMGMNWFIDPLQANPVPAHVLAENILALVFLPKLSPGDQTAGKYTDQSLAPGYAYDSTTVGAGASDANLNSLNQLPPVITVTMVAVDESSYNRLQGTSTKPPGSLKFDALFQSVGDTSDPAQPGFAQDLKTLTDTLQANRLNYRVFTTDVALKSAKWSRTQTK